MAKSTTIIAFDQHAATTVAAILLPGQRTPALHQLTSDIPTILRFVDGCVVPGRCRVAMRPARAGSSCSARWWRSIPCHVIAPALIPRRPGRSHQNRPPRRRPTRPPYRAGALTAIHIPTEQEEAARDLLRCREDIRADLLRARHRLSHFLLRHGRRFTATKRAWTKRHAEWLQAQRWPVPALEQTTAPMSARSTRRSRAASVDQELRDLLTLEPLRARVERLRCFRGIQISLR